MGAFDLDFVGKMFTWENRQTGQAYIKERLNKFLAYREWLNFFGDVTVEHLMAEVSDHIPILLNTAGNIQM